MLTRQTYLIIYEQDGFRVHDSVTTWLFFGFIPIFSTRTETQRRGTIADEALRKAVFRADDYECVYCGFTEQAGLTVDHLIPQVNGGATIYENLVTSCGSCNSKKGGRTPEEAGMALCYGRYFPTQFEWPPHQQMRSHRHYVAWHRQRYAFAQELTALVVKADAGDSAALAEYHTLTAKGFVFDDNY